MAIDEAVIPVETGRLSCVVYDVKSGKVIHVHEVVNPTTETIAARKEVEARAIALAMKVRKSVSRSTVAVLHVDPKELAGRVPLRVNVAKKALVRQELRRPAKGKRRPRGTRA